MSDQAYMLKGEATITLTGVAKVIDIHGNTLRECDLGTGEPVTVKLESTNAYWPQSHCGVTFRIDDVFEGRVVKIGDFQ